MFELIYPLWFHILCIHVLLFAAGYAAYCSAVQDTVKHRFKDSIFYKPGTKKKMFGFDWNWWFGSASKNKYLLTLSGELALDDDGNYIKRKTKILFWNIHLLQIYDAWHHYKMRKIVFWIIAAIACGGVITLFPFNYHLIWKMVAVFFVVGIAWNVVFNKFYDKILRR